MMLSCYASSPITPTGAAKRWVDRLPLGTIDFWDLLKKAFIQRENQERGLIQDERFEEWCTKNPNTPTSRGYSERPRERNFEDYKWIFDLEIDQLADEHKLGIGKKGHMLDDIWENCRKVQGDNTYWWHDQKSEEEERRKLRINIEEIDGCLANGKRKRVKIQGFSLRRNEIQGLLDSFSCSGKVLYRRNHKGYVVTDIITV
uniref:RNA-directed DNA polymerase, eukaryota, reverse transcriptase zinc-binding domain protein n=1 Tax=Tanacetum cinerariifolium TaxID=118510 RepID=A0A6L2N148_TANCI|nr:RNA-directed DNA polymerase, eukaryota, reverse transcriptase zinc-binding domain protein [Tanacetum cinerariifolium]